MSAGSRKIKPVDYDSEEAITIEEFAKKIAKFCDTGVKAEYAMVCSENPASTFVAFHKNVNKNRRLDIQCYDKRRVVLTSKHDYIHANYVDGYRHKCGFICAQGPLMSTVIDFWQMVWQEGCVVIVSLTRFIESGEDKCAPYWPTSQSKVIRYGRFLVGTEKIVNADDHTYVVSDITLTHRETDEERNLKHLLYLRWLDGSVPDNASDLLRFRDVIREHSKEAIANAIHWRQPQGPPIVVHGAAGVGRTGTLVALEICLRQLEQTGKVDVPGVVKKLRRQRYQAIHKADQYAFLNLIIMEYAVNKNYLKTDGAELDGNSPKNRPPDRETGAKRTTSDTAMV